MYHVMQHLVNHLLPGHIPKRLRRGSTATAAQEQPRTEDGLFQDKRPGHVSPDTTPDCEKWTRVELAQEARIFSGEEVLHHPNFDATASATPQASEIIEDADERCTVAGATGSFNTPVEYREAARKVMGSIDMDPASCDMAEASLREIPPHKHNPPDLPRIF
jgi:hypothetical protein